MLFSVSPAVAGSQSAGKMHFKQEDIVKFSKKVEKILAQKGVWVAIIARLGRPKNELPKEVNYTHTAFAVYSQITTADNRKIPGYAIYNLYQNADKPDISDLIQDFPVDFFPGQKCLKQV